MKKNLLIAALCFISIALQAQYWSQQNTNLSGTSTGVDQVSVVDSNIVWINGFNGSGMGGHLQAMAVTNDGGNTWTPGTYSGIGAGAQTTVLTGVSATNAFGVVYDTALATPSFWKTTNGGSSWSVVTGILNGGTTFADGVKFWDSQNGFCFGDPVSGSFDIYNTSDGGTTWNAVSGANSTVPLSNETGYNGTDCSYAVPGGIGFFITSAGRIYRTIDYGVTWAVTPNAPFTSAAYSASVYASSANYIIAANWDDVNSVWDWVYTSDGGTIWQTYAPTSGPFYQYAMCYVPGTVNMFVTTSADYQTPNEGVAYSTDGGMTFTDYTDATWLQPQGTNIQCLGVGFCNDRIGWVGNYDQQQSINSILNYHAPLILGFNTYSVAGNDLNIYPNPSNVQVFFSLNGQNKEDFNLKVFDITGSLVFAKTLNMNGISNTSYDVTGLAKGMYIINISSVNDQITKKLIIN